MPAANRDAFDMVTRSYLFDDEARRLTTLAIMARQAYYEGKRWRFVRESEAVFGRVYVVRRVFRTSLGSPRIDRRDPPVLGRWTQDGWFWLLGDMPMEVSARADVQLWTI